MESYPSPHFQKSEGFCLQFAVVRGGKTNYFNMYDLLLDACDHPCCITVLLYKKELKAKEQVRSATTYSSCYGNKPT